MTNLPGFQPKQPPVETKLVQELAIETLSSSTNEKLVKFASETDRKIEKLANSTAKRFERVEGWFDQMNNMYRNIELQIGQIY